MHENLIAVANSLWGVDGFSQMLGVKKGQA
jgi:hypothetical protein